MNADDSVCKSKGPQRGNQNKWKVIIETIRKSVAQWKKKDCMQLESRMEARFSTFSANRCDWISISCSENLMVILHSSDTQNSFAYFTVKTKAYKVIISHVVQL